ncbi:hypothetical protein [Streptomyces sp. NPDC003996]
MRRTARALSVAFVAGAALALAGPAATADVGPGTPSLPPVTAPTVVPDVGPGTLYQPPVTAPTVVPDPCAAPQQCVDPLPGPAATCRPGEPCQDGAGCKPGEVCPSDPGPGWSKPGEGRPSGPSAGCRPGEACPTGPGPACGPGEACPDEGHRCAQGQYEPCLPGRPCGEPDGRQPHGTDGCEPPTVQYGVEAGTGGSFSDSVPALAAGAAFIAAACGGAGYRLYGARRAAGGRSTDA